MDLSATRGRISNAEKARRRAQGLCMYYGGTGHFAAQCPARPAASKAAGTPGGSSGNRRAITAAGATVTPSPAPTGHVSEVDSDSDDESGKGGAQV